MGWISIREYTEKTGVSVSTVRRQIRRRRLCARKFGRDWYIELPEDSTFPFSGGEAARAGALMASFPPESSQIDGVIEFSSKALHHYLILSEKLIAEKDLRLQEKDAQLAERKQQVAELECYVELLEKELEKQKQKPEGWF